MNNIDDNDNIVRVGNSYFNRDEFPMLFGMSVTVPILPCIQLDLTVKQD